MAILNGLFVMPEARGQKLNEKHVNFFGQQCIKISCVVHTIRFVSFVYRLFSG